MFERHPRYNSSLFAGYTDITIDMSKHYDSLKVSIKWDDNRTPYTVSITKACVTGKEPNFLYNGMRQAIAD